MGLYVCVVVQEASLRCSRCTSQGDLQPVKLWHYKQTLSRINILAKRSHFLGFVPQQSKIVAYVLEPVGAIVNAENLAMFCKGEWVSDGVMESSKE